MVAEGREAPRPLPRCQTPRRHPCPHDPQNLDLLLLAPDIQEEILVMEPIGAREPVCQRHFRSSSFRSMMYLMFMSGPSPLGIIPAVARTRSYFGADVDPGGL